MDQRNAECGLRIGLLTGGRDKPYALGLARVVAGLGIGVDFIGSDELDVPELRQTSSLVFLNLRGDMRKEAGPLRKVLRVLRYYHGLICYAATCRAKVFHILWNNKFEFLDRTVLILLYRLLGKRVVLTAHNVNTRSRDSNDSRLNRITLRIQYKLVDHIFVHTNRMKDQLAQQFAVHLAKISVIPFGINNTVSVTGITPSEARERVGAKANEKVLLFFGRIAPYKGLHVLLAALEEVTMTDEGYRLIIAGNVKDCPDYWHKITQQMSRNGLEDRVIGRIEHIPDDDTELYFKAADVLILPYTDVFQSGVLVLAYSFGLPVIAADVGSLREDVAEGKTGYIFRPRDPTDLARAIRAYFSSPLFSELETRRQEIRDYANERYSWSTVGEIIKRVYAELLAN